MGSAAMAAKTPVPVKDLGATDSDFVAVFPRLLNSQGHLTTASAVPAPTRAVGDSTVSQPEVLSPVPLPPELSNALQRTMHQLQQPPAVTASAVDWLPEAAWQQQRDTEAERAAKRLLGGQFDYNSASRQLQQAAEGVQALLARTRPCNSIASVALSTRDRAAAGSNTAAATAASHRDAAPASLREPCLQHPVDAIGPGLAGAAAAGRTSVALDGGVWPAGPGAPLSPLAAFYEQEDNWQNVDRFNKAVELEYTWRFTQPPQARNQRRHGVSTEMGEATIKQAAAAFPRLPPAMDEHPVDRHTTKRRPNSPTGRATAALLAAKPSQPLAEKQPMPGGAARVSTSAVGSAEAPKQSSSSSGPELPAIAFGRRASNDVLDSLLSALLEAQQQQRQPKQPKQPKNELSTLNMIPFLGSGRRFKAVYDMQHSSWAPAQQAQHPDADPGRPSAAISSFSHPGAGSGDVLEWPPAADGLLHSTEDQFMDMLIDDIMGQLLLQKPDSVRAQAAAQPLASTSASTGKVCQAAAIEANIPQQADQSSIEVNNSGHMITNSSSAEWPTSEVLAGSGDWGAQLLTALARVLPQFAGDTLSNSFLAGHMELFNKQCGGGGSAAAPARHAPPVHQQALLEGQPQIEQQYSKQQAPLLPKPSIVADVGDGGMQATGSAKLQQSSQPATEHVAPNYILDEGQSHVAGAALGGDVLLAAGSAMSVRTAQGAGSLSSSSGGGDFACTSDQHYHGTETQHADSADGAGAAAPEP
eukprot:gene3517-3786_t